MTSVSPVDKHFRCETPIVFVIFNRPEQTERVFQRIAAVQPTRLLIIADGPRSSKAGESALCAQVRAIVARVNWPCEIQQNFSDVNLGCRSRLITGLNWAFEQVDAAIILEDDILPDLTFFRFCEEMVTRFRDDDRVAMVSGFNIVQDHAEIEDSYYFSRLTHIWGWATWRRAWRRYDEHLADWPAIRDHQTLSNLFETRAEIEFWTRIFNQMHDGTGPNTWDYQWVYTNFINSLLTVVPRTSLVENIGFGIGATHTTDAAHAFRLQVRAIDFPLQHPKTMVPRRDLDALDADLSGFYVPSLWRRAVNRLHRMLKARAS